MLATRGLLRSEFLETGRFLWLLGIEALLELIELAPQFLGTLFFCLLCTYFLDGALDLRIASCQDFLRLGTRIVDNLTVLGTNVIQALVIVGDHLIKTLLLSPHVLSLVLPVTAVTHDVEQVLVHVDVVAAHNLAGLVNDRLRQTRLAGNLNGKRTAGVAHRQLEERLHALAVIEHRAVDHTVGLVSKMLEVLIMGSHHAHHFVLIELFEYRLSDSTANLRLGAATHLIDEDERLLASLGQEQFHILQVAAVGAQVVLDALLVTDVDENIAEQSHVGIVTQRGQQAALHHVLHHTHRLEAHRLAAGIGPRNDQDAVFFVQIDIEGHDFLTLIAQ